MIKTECANCRHGIDAAAKICPYCGANPSTGEKVVDSDRLLQEVFQPREISTSESVMEYARQRQGVVIAIGSIVVFVILGALHQFVTQRNASAVADSPSVPLTEITDLANRTDQTKPVAMPDLDFQYDGRPEAMKTFIIEAGAVTPPEVLAAKQAAAAAPRPGVPSGSGVRTPASGAVQPRPVVTPQQRVALPQRPAPPRQ